MERFTVLLKPVRLKLKCDLNFQGRDGKSSHASFCKVLCSNIKSDLKTMNVQRVVFSVQISFLQLIVLCSILSTCLQSSSHCATAVSVV